MTVQAGVPLNRMLRECELGWLVDWYEPPQEALGSLLESLEVADRESRARFGADGPRLDEAALYDEYQRNPQKVTAFLQALAATRTPEMLVMAWRILQGGRIVSITLNYEARTRFGMDVTLEAPGGGPEERYRSTDVLDAALLRHVGIAKVDGAPLLDGFYPLRLA